jgi:Mg2+-importing ATPase
LGRGARQPTLPAPILRVRVLRGMLDFLTDAEPRLARSLKMLGLASGWQLSIIGLDAATLWVLIRSLGVHASAGGVFASFMLANLFRSIGLSPGGLGTFEAMSVVALKIAGVPVATALSATLMFRFLSFWLPMPIGFALYQRRLRFELQGPKRAAR